MSLINVPTDLVSTEPKPRPQRKINKASRSRAYLLKIEWGWEDIRDYVIYEIESRFGVIERDFKESQIFKGFHKRWGVDAKRIVKYVFDVEDGFWHNKPIDIYRFTSGSDKHFASVIIDRLNAADKYRT